MVQLKRNCITSGILYVMSVMEFAEEGSRAQITMKVSLRCMEV